MSARDEMIEVILPVLEKCFDSDWNMTYSEMVTDALIAAGYRKQRTITTAAELGALPFNSIVMYDEGFRLATAERQAEDMRWYVTGCLEYIRPEAIIPATVIWEPQP